MKKFATVFLIALIAVTALFAEASNEKVYELKLSTTQGETSMIYAGMKAAADKVYADTNGHVVVKIYPSSQLGAEEDMIDQALQGMNIAVLTDAGRLSFYVPDMGVMNMAYFVNNYDDGCKVMATDTFKGWDAELVKKGLKGICYNFYDGSRSFCGHRAFTKPADLKGVVIRTPGAKPYVESIKALGATPYNIGWSEVYNGIQTKAIDGCEVQLTSLVSSRIYEVCKYYSLTEHIQLFNMVVCGEKWFNTLPAEYQKVLCEDFFNCAYTNAKDIEKAQLDLRATAEKNGMHFVDVDMAAFQKAADKAYEVLGWSQLRKDLHKQAGI